MDKVLKKRKTVTVMNDTIVVTSKVAAEDFDEKEFCEPSCLARYFIVEKEFYGIARLKDGDKDNVRKAIYIAESKMERQYHKYILKCIKLEIKETRKFLNQITDMRSKYKNIVSAINNHIIDIAKHMDDED